MISRLKKGEQAVKDSWHDARFRLWSGEICQLQVTLHSVSKIRLVLFRYHSRFAGSGLSIGEDRAVVTRKNLI